MATEESIGAVSFGQELQNENTHTLAVGVDVVLLGRAESVVLIGRPGDRARHTCESDLNLYFCI